MRGWLEKNRELVWSVLGVLVFCVAFGTTVGMTADKNKETIDNLQARFDAHCEKTQKSQTDTAVSIAEIKKDISHMRQDYQRLTNAIERIVNDAYIRSNSSGRDNRVRDFRGSQNQ